MRSVAYSISLVVTLALGFSSPGNCDDYPTQVRSTYPFIFVARIVDAAAVTAMGRTCFYKYDSEVLEDVHGHFRKNRLSFYSQLGLVEGDEYLVFFSEADAVRLRYGPISNGDKVGQKCEQLVSGYLLLYNELHHVQRTWNGKRLVRTVEFNDAWADFGTEHSIDKAVRLVDFDYVKTVLSQNTQ